MISYLLLVGKCVSQILICYFYLFLIFFLDLCTFEDFYWPTPTTVFCYSDKEGLILFLSVKGNISFSFSMILAKGFLIILSK